MKIKVPTQLDIRTCFNPPNIIQFSNEIQIPENILSDNRIEKLIKSNLPLQKQKYYSEKFVKIFLLIKINSLASQWCDINTIFIQQLKSVYNLTQLDKIQVSNSECQILCQILIKINTISINIQEFNNIIEGNALLAASAIWLSQFSQLYLHKQQIAFSLSFTALLGSKIPFTPIVHQQKNHKGQIHFARRVTQLIETKIPHKKQFSKIQDPYSVRCSPQVHGVAYDCLTELKNNLHLIINRGHFQYINVKGKKIRNLVCQSDTFTLKMDFLICSLQEIGAMAFVRMQRILNQYLGNNKLKQRQQYPSLCSMLHSSLSSISKNKLLSEMTNFDTSCIDSYKKDIFYNTGMLYTKINQLIDNLYYLMTLEILASLEVIKQLAVKHDGVVEFVNQQMDDNYRYLLKATSPHSKNDSFQAVKELWQVKEQVFVKNEQI